MSLASFPRFATRACKRNPPTFNPPFLRNFSNIRWRNYGSLRRTNSSMLAAWVTPSIKLPELSSILVYGRFGRTLCLICYPLTVLEDNAFNDISEQLITA